PLGWLAARAEPTAGADVLYDGGGHCDVQSVAASHIGERYALAEAAQAHQDLESRRAAGRLLLLPRCRPTTTKRSARTHMHVRRWRRCAKCTPVAACRGADTLPLARRVVPPARGIRRWRRSS